MTGIDFQIQLVPFATVTGVVAGTDEFANVLLVPADSPGGLGRLGGQTLTGRAQADGTFVISNVPPGRYIAVARSGGRSGDPRTAIQSLTVNGQNIEGLTLMLQPGVTLAGNITVESAGTPAPTDYSSFRIDAPEVDPLPIGGGGRGGGPGGGPRREERLVQIGNLLPGRHYIRVTGGGGQGQWTLKSVLVGATDVTDDAVELKPGHNVGNVTVVLSDQPTEIAGTVRDAHSMGVGGVTVVAFPMDRRFWRAQSRHIQVSRTGQDGQYRIRGLPPGDYYLVATDDVEQGEWFDPAYLEQVEAAGTRVTLGEGDRKTQDLRGPS